MDRITVKPCPFPGKCNNCLNFNEHTGVCDDGYSKEAPPATSAFSTQVGGSHYTGFALQPFEISMANKLDAMQHTIIKYVMRFRAKNGIEDLNKAKHVIDLLIEWEQNANQK